MLLVPLPGPTASASGSGSSLALRRRSASEGQEGLQEVIKRVRTAKRIVVVCGAGISTAASIPDFRSSTGLFSRHHDLEPYKGQGSDEENDGKSGSVGNDKIGTVKGKRKGRPAGHNLKDLFHVKCLTSAALLPEHHALLNELASQCHAAEPTPFHQFMSKLDSQGRLLRCYTQNIDGLEERAGLEVGIPMPPVPRVKAKSPRVQTHTPRKKVGQSDLPPTPVTPTSPTPAVTPTSNTPLADKTISPRTEVYSPPRCIPLHGVLTSLHCPLCHASSPLAPHLPLPPSPLPCPECHLASTIRHALSERSRRIGHLRASVVLYGEEHPQGERIGSVIERDLKPKPSRGSGDAGTGGVNMLLVAGTSLTIPGVKRLVKEMSRVLHSRYKDRDKGGPRTILVNNECPKGAEWEGVFDVWIKGDIQQFITEYVDSPLFTVPSTPTKPKVTTPRSAKRDGGGSVKKGRAGRAAAPPTPVSTPKRKRPDSSDFTTPTHPRKRAGHVPPTPDPTPPSLPGTITLGASSPGRKGGGGDQESEETKPFWSRFDLDRSLTPISDISGEVENPFLLSGVR